MPPVLSLSLYVALNGRVRSLGKTPLQITQFVQTTQLMVNSSRAAAGRPVVKAHHYIDTSRGNAVVSTDCKCYSHSARGCCTVFIVQCRTYVALNAEAPNGHCPATVLLQEGTGKEKVWRCRWDEGWWNGSGRNVRIVSV